MKGKPASGGGGWTALSGPAKGILGLLPYGLLGLGPPLWLILSSVNDPSGFQLCALASGRIYLLLSKTLLLAASTAVLSVILGLGCALWLSGGRGFLRRFGRTVYLAPLFIPSYLVTLCWMSLMGRGGGLHRILEWAFGAAPSPYGFPGALWVYTVTLFPLVTLFALAALESISSDTLESGKVQTGPGDLWRRGVLPLLFPSAAAGGSLAFVLTLTDHGTASLLQFPTYAMEIFADFSQSGAPSRALALSIPLLALTAVPFLAFLFLERRTPLFSKNPVDNFLPVSDRPTPLKFWGAVSAAFLLLSIAVPVITLLHRTGSVNSFRMALASSSREMAVSLFTALGAAILTTACAWPLTRALFRSKSLWLRILCFLPLAVPAPLFGIAVVHLGNLPILRELSGSPAILVLTHTGRFLPIALLIQVLFYRRVDPYLFEAASLPRVSRLRRFAAVILPLETPAWLASGLAVFALSLGEIGATLLVTPPGYGTFPGKLFNLLHYGAGDQAAGMALGLLLILLTGGGAAVALHRWRRH